MKVKGKNGNWKRKKVAQSIKNGVKHLANKYFWDISSETFPVVSMISLGAILSCNKGRGMPVC